MLNPFKRVIVYPRFHNIGWSSYTRKSLKRNKFFQWYVWSHRAIYSFGVGDKIKYNDDLLILSHGWIKGAPKYEEEEERIQQVRSMFKDGKLVIETLQQARFLAIRFAESVA